MTDAFGNLVTINQSVVRCNARKTVVYLVIGEYAPGVALVKKVLNEPGFPSSDQRPAILNISKYSMEVVANLPEPRDQGPTLVSDLACNPRVSKNIVAEFRFLEFQLSPKELTLNGTLSESEVSERRKALLGKWGLLEAYIGKRVVVA